MTCQQGFDDPLCSYVFEVD